MPIISLRNLSLSFGHHALLDNVSFDINDNQRLCLIGRNGAGKSSLFKIISGEIAPDTGERISHQGAYLASLRQDVPQNSDHHTVKEVILQGLNGIGDTLIKYTRLIENATESEALDQLSQLQKDIDQHQAWDALNEVEILLSKLSLSADVRFDALSGGLKRRVLLAQALIQKPKLLLLDEPTNHLDIDSIHWLEEFLKQFKGSILFITHDRQFLQNVATDIVELDRGKLYSYPGSYDKFLQQKEAALHNEQKEAALFDKKLADEEKWIRQGIKARRTRNEGRVRALKQMREQRAQRREKQGVSKIEAATSQNKAKVVLIADNISFQYEDKKLFSDFSCQINRGDKIGILGPNGVGKSTLIQVLLKKIVPSTGAVKHGDSVDIAYFDQLRASLDLERSVIDNVLEGKEYININGKEKHIISYLQDFLFSPQRAQSPVSSLSGGEKNRLLLAKLLAKPSNVLVLDEPTNDLDIETLEILEEMLVNYQGTVLLISHDRTFINNLVTSTIVFEAGGKLNEYIGGYDDWLSQTSAKRLTDTSKASATSKNTKGNKPESKSRKPKLSYAERKELNKLPNDIETLESEIASIQADIASSNFYRQETDVIKQTNLTLESLNAALEQKYARWEMLAEIEANNE
ncbi:ATP-binding cassette domain-containing protein [Fangia hongkongensis]|uniref:ATP-binding cassette domain-containing protein n=1 Tax=Fangia hongkongensis TaxID=270495 RepID=UPI000365A3B8|nr:ATP-binding cassette domain-containing protein [Fangia hongkongensis]MBK2125480.1 ATP-binding cassette domain-containing protein [Fangia hongkongensis]